MRANESLDQGRTIMVVGGAALALMAGSLASALPTAVTTTLCASVVSVAVMTRNLRAAFVVVAGLVTVLPIALFIDVGAQLPLVTVSRGLVALLLLAALIGWLGGRVELRMPPLRWAILLWLVAVALSIAGSVDPGASVLRFGSDVVEYFFLAYLGFLVLDARSLRILMTVLIAAGAVNAALGLSDLLHLGYLQHLASAANASFDRSSNALVSSGDVRLGVSRIQGTFQHPTFLAASLTMLLPIAYTFVLQGSRREKAIAGFFLVLAVPAIIFTGTRTAWLVSALSIIAIWAYWWPSLRAVQRHAYAVIAVGFGAALMVPAAIGNAAGLIADVFTTSSGSSALTTGYRLFLFRRSWTAAETHLLTGFGYGNFDRAGVSGFFHGLAISLTSADSHVVRLLVEVGVVGVAAFAVLVAATVRLEVHATRAGIAPQMRALAFGALVATVGFLIMNLTVSALAITQVGFLYWILVMACAVIQRDRI